MMARSSGLMRQDRRGWAIQSTCRNSRRDRPLVGSRNEPRKLVSKKNIVGTFQWAKSCKLFPWERRQRWQVILRPQSGIASKRSCITNKPIGRKSPAPWGAIRPRSAGSCAQHVRRDTNTTLSKRSVWPSVGADSGLWSGRWPIPRSTRPSASGWRRRGSAATDRRPDEGEDCDRRVSHQTIYAWIKQDPDRQHWESLLRRRGKRTGR